MGFLAGIGAWFTQRVGTFFASVIVYLLEKWIKRLWNFGQAKIAEYKMKRERRAAQKTAESKQEENIEKGAPRNEQTRKDELDNLNS